MDAWIKSASIGDPGLYTISLRNHPSQPQPVGPEPSDEEFEQMLQAGYEVVNLLPPPKVDHRRMPMDGVHVAHDGVAGVLRL